MSKLRDVLREEYKHWNDLPAETRTLLESLCDAVDEQRRYAGAAAAPDGLDVDCEPEMWIRRSLGRDISNRGWWGGVAVRRSGREAAGLARIGREEFLGFRDGDGGGGDRLLCPVGPAALLPGNTEFVVSSGPGTLLIGFVGAGLEDPIEVSPSVRGLSLGLWAGGGAGSRLIVDRLRMRPWQPIGPAESFVPMREVAGGSVGVPQPEELASRELIAIPVRALEGMRRVTRAEKEMYWFEIPWPEDAGEAVLHLERHLRFNVVLYSDRIPAARDTGVAPGGRLTIQPLETLRVPHTFEVLDVYVPETNARYVDRRVVTDPQQPVWRRTDREGPGSGPLGEIVLDPHPASPARVEFQYVPTAPPLGLVGGSELTPSRGARLSGSVVGRPYTGWHDRDHRDTWAAFCSEYGSRSRADTPRGVRLLVAAFPLGGLGQYVDPEKIRFRRRWGRIQREMMPYVEVRVPLSSNAPFSELDIGILAQEMTQYLQSRAGFNTIVRVMLESAEVAA